MDFVALDFETANRNRASICQIGIARVLGGVITKHATLYVNPPPGHHGFEQRNINVHGIRAADIQGAPGWPEILERMVRFVGPLPIVAHSISVERGMIKAATEACGLSLPEFTYYCSLKLARRLAPEQPSHSLGKLSASLGLPGFNHHDAGEDAMASARLVVHLARQVGQHDVNALFAALEKRRY